MNKINQCELNNCKEGEYIFYNESENQISCQKCPMGTYTSQNTLKFSNWSDDLLKKLKVA